MAARPLHPPGETAACSVGAAILGAGRGSADVRSQGPDVAGAGGSQRHEQQRGALAAGHGIFLGTAECRVSGVTGAAHLGCLALHRHAQLDQRCAWPGQLAFRRANPGDGRCAEQHLAGADTPADAETGSAARLWRPAAIAAPGASCRQWDRVGEPFHRDAGAQRLGRQPAGDGQHPPRLFLAWGWGAQRPVECPARPNAGVGGQRFAGGA
ncbi:hypothetical protein D3C75_946310 [compost metagenome]